MTDIDDLLIKITKRCNLVHNYPADRELLKESAEQIESLRLELDMMQATILVPSQKDDRRTIERLRAENERMYSLLVEAQDYIDDIYDELYIAIGKELEVQDYLRFAKKALGETNENP